MPPHAALGNGRRRYTCGIIVAIEGPEVMTFISKIDSTHNGFAGLAISISSYLRGGNPGLALYSVY